MRFLVLKRRDLYFFEDTALSHVLLLFLLNLVFFLLSLHCLKG